jgi:hypothetical protein
MGHEQYAVAFAAIAFVERVSSSADESCDAMLLGVTDGVVLDGMRWGDGSYQQSLCYQRLQSEDVAPQLGPICKQYMSRKSCKNSKSFRHSTHPRLVYEQMPEI